MSTETAGGRAPIATSRFATLRRDAWWTANLTTVVTLMAFIAYGIWAGLNNDYYVDPYLAPFHSPCIAANCTHVSFGPIVGDWWKLTPAGLILPIPLGLRLTCYYYRKAYYRAFWQSPPACAVTEPHSRYGGETRFPLILQNVHRYFFYGVIPFIFFFAWESIQAFRFPDGFGMGLGTLVLIANTVLLALYVFSCHSCRHLCGGHLDSFARAPLRYRFWKFVTRMNIRHGEIAWVSMVGVGLADLYVRLLAMGVITDPRFF
ncbi:MAG: hypothetical protein ACRDI3_07675 [Actinomycetota bacterium]